MADNDTLNGSTLLEILGEEVGEYQPTPRKKRQAKEPVVVKEEEVRSWESVLPRIKEMKELGRSVPEIAQELGLSYVLVNQVFLQSYKMTVQTKELFERQERARAQIYG